MRRDGRVQVVFYKYQFGRNARRCMDRPRVCPYVNHPLGGERTMENFSRNTYNACIMIGIAGH